MQLYIKEILSKDTKLFPINRRAAHQHTPSFRGCPTITVSNEIKLSAGKLELFYKFVFYPL